jgi:N-carbamoyl-L-amino-acid hydrolase
VLGGGRYDGPLGLLAALEVARALGEHEVLYGAPSVGAYGGHGGHGGHALRHDLEVCDYLAEEVSVYGISCVGSRALAGTLRAEWLTRVAPDGRTLAEALRDSGGDPTLLETARRAPGSIHAALELHIEQGPRLERAGAQLAAVSGIVGIRRGVFQLIGQADHAGTTPMDMRRDALAAAAEITLRLEALARAEPEAIGTVGRLEIAPNQGNVVAGLVQLTAEVRSLRVALIERLWDELLEAARAACAGRGVALDLAAMTEVAPAVPPSWLLDILLAVCRRLDPQALALPSGAGHDTGHLAALAPAAMLFVPSAGGRSHCPEEHTAPEQLALGAQALLEAVLEVDTR